MRHPKNRDTLTLFKCPSPELGLESFTAFPAATKNSIFTLNSDEISAIEIILPPHGSISYEEYLRKHNIIIKHQTIKVKSDCFEIETKLEFDISKIIF